MIAENIKFCQIQSQPITIIIFLWWWQIGQKDSRPHLNSGHFQETKGAKRETRSARMTVGIQRRRRPTRRHYNILFTHTQIRHKFPFSIYTRMDQKFQVPLFITITIIPIDKNWILSVSNWYHTRKFLSSSLEYKSSCEEPITIQIITIQPIYTTTFLNSCRCRCLIRHSWIGIAIDMVGMKSNRFPRRLTDGAIVTYVCRHGISDDHDAELSWQQQKQRRQLLSKYDNLPSIFV